MRCFTSSIICFAGGDVLVPDEGVEEHLHYLLAELVHFHFHFLFFRLLLRWLQLALAAGCAAVVYRLLHVQRYVVLVFGQRGNVHVRQLDGNGHYV